MLTEAPLTCGTPITESRCGTCMNCVESCSGHAVNGKLWRQGMAREEKK